MEGRRGEDLFETSHVLGAHLASTPLLPQAWRQCTIANAGAARFVVEQIDNVVYVAFSGAQTLHAMTGGPAGPAFLDSVPLRTGGPGIFPQLVDDDDQDGEPVLVHACSLHLFLAIYNSPEFKMLVSETCRNKAVILTGHSMAASLSSLAALYFLSSSTPSSLLCITFGTPLLGNAPLSQAILRERWAANFCHVVTHHDPVPRLLLAEQQNTPYTPFGSYLLCSSDGAVCIDNPAVIIRILSLTARSSDRLSYDNLVINISKLSLLQKRIHNFNQIPATNYAAGISLAVQASGVGSSQLVEIRECLTAAKRLGLSPNLNCANLATRLGKITPCRAQIEWYKASCDEDTGYYDAFKYRNASIRESKVNMNRVKLAGFWDDFVVRLQNHQLPHDIHRRSKWVNAAHFYQLLVEPLDIAEYYRGRMWETKGHYVTHGRARRYQVFDKWWRDGKKDLKKERRTKFAGLTQDSCFWAKVEEAKEWMESARGERDIAVGLVQVWEKLNGFQSYAEELVARKEVSRDVLAPGSSYSLWREGWTDLKMEMGMQIPP